MFLIRIAGIWLMLIAVVTLVIDGTKSLASSQIIWTGLGEQWADNNKESLLTAKLFVEQKLHHFLWEPIIYSILLWPSWFIIGLTGLFLYWVARKKHHTQTFIN